MKTNNNDEVKDKTMRYLITLSLASLLLFFGCDQQGTDITSPISSSNQLENDWITLPTPSGLSVNNQTFSASELIDGSKGGLISLIGDYNGGPFGKVKIYAFLNIPKGAFIGTEEITMTCFPNNGTVRFGPSKVFDMDLDFSLEYDGVDLTGIDPDQVKFCYIAADGSLEVAEHKSIQIQTGKGKIKVNSVRITHFSRYGFVN